MLRIEIISKPFKSFQDGSSNGLAGLSKMKNVMRNPKSKAGRTSSRAAAGVCPRPAISDIPANLASTLASRKCSSNQIAVAAGISVTRVNVLRRQGKSALEIVSERRGALVNGHHGQGIPRVAD